MNKKAQAELFVRSFLLQACWSFERMQGLGLAFCIEPWLKRCWRDDDSCRQALLRHQDYFNTQPYMASMVMGMVCALEEQAAAAAPEESAGLIARIKTLKTAAAAALAGIGDALFWGALRPFCAALALCVMLLWPGGATAGLAAAAVYLTVYNAVAVTLRWRGLALGYQWRDQIAPRLKDFGWQGWIRKLRLGGAVLVFLAAGTMLFRAPPNSPKIIGVAGLAVGLASFRFLPFRVSTLRLYSAVCVLGALAAAAGWL